jgi:hypothetical protein
MNWLPWLFALSLTASPGRNLALNAASPAAKRPVALSSLCAPQLQLLHPEQCPAFGPGAYSVQFAAIKAPDVIPELPAELLPKLDPVVDFTYARVKVPNAPLFASPADGVAGTVTRTLGTGFVFVNVVNTVQEGDQTFYQIKPGEYIRAADVTLVTPTGFRGVTFSENPAYPFGWVVLNVRPSLMPGMPASAKSRALTRRSLVQILATQRVGDWNWYLIGPQQWVEQRAIARVDVNPPPEGVSGKWIQVNLYEQTLAAYEDNRLVFATLVSSGLDKWPTRPGLFQIYVRLKADGMQGSYVSDGSDYYYLETVPWVMYFDGQRALHGEYWHDGLGFKRSHGCVNLAPLDARWLFNWAPKGTAVWVYDPSGQTPTDVEGGGAP